MRGRTCAEGGGCIACDRNVRGGVLALGTPEPTEALSFQASRRWWWKRQDALTVCMELMLDLSANAIEFTAACA